MNSSGLSATQRVSHFLAACEGSYLLSKNHKKVGKHIDRLEPSWHLPKSDARKPRRDLFGFGFRLWCGLKHDRSEGLLTEFSFLKQLKQHQGAARHGWWNPNVRNIMPGEASAHWPLEKCKFKPSMIRQHNTCYMIKHKAFLHLILLCHSSHCDLTHWILIQGLWHFESIFLRSTNDILEENVMVLSDSALHVFEWNIEQNNSQAALCLLVCVCVCSAKCGIEHPDAKQGQLAS